MSEEKCVKTNLELLKGNERIHKDTLKQNNKGEN